MNEAYLEALRTATKELTELTRQKAELDRRMLHVRQTVATLMRLCGHGNDQDITNKGITDAIREALLYAPKDDPFVAAKTLKLFLETVGYDFEHYKNPIASVTGTLQRFVEKGLVEPARRKNAEGEKVWMYRWKAEAEETK